MQLRLRPQDKQGLPAPNFTKLSHIQSDSREPNFTQIGQ